jgi:tRNA-specific 2-thiouridylase
MLEDAMNLGVDKPRSETRVVVAMSGGVDSSATAALLAEAGYDVVGVTLQLYDNGAAKGKKGACCAGQDIYDARRVADRIGFPHYVLDFESRFRDSVIDDFADSYLRGETPVPCIRCNERVKFRDLLDIARDLGADALATGHYAGIQRGPAGPELHQGFEAQRDQSYFLFSTTREQLTFLRFPLGGMTKDAVRGHAARLGLDIAEKPDSQDICFVPNGSYASVVQKLRPGAIDPGEIVDLDGRVLGHHEGILNFTIGQRRGLGIAASQPLYVVSIDAEARRVVVGPHAALLCDRIETGPLNWLGEGPPAEAEVTLRTRSTHPGAPATLYPTGEGGGARLELHTPEPATARGQAAVVYDGTRLIGGAWITDTGRSQALEKRARSTPAALASAS